MPSPRIGFVPLLLAPLALLTAACVHTGDSASVQAPPPEATPATPAPVGSPAPPSAPAPSTSPPSAPARGRGRAADAAAGHRAGRVDRRTRERQTRGPGCRRTGPERPRAAPARYARDRRVHQAVPQKPGR